MAGPWEDYQPQAQNAPWEEYASFKMAKAPEKQSSSFGNPADMVAGAVRGAGSIGATLLAPLDMAKDAIAGKGLSLESNRQRRADMDSALKELGANTDSYAYGGGKLIGEIAGTAGAGGVLAKPLLSVAPKLAQAIASSGFSAGAPASGLIGRAADMGARMAGGAISGGMSAGLVGENPTMGAAIGGAFPPAAKAIGVAGGAIGRGVSSIFTPQQQAMAKQIASMTGKKLEDVIAAIDKQGPSILGIKPTVPQILQDDAISQLQRSVINAGDKSIMAREAEQNLQRLAGLERIAPVMGTVNEAADSAGNMIGKFGKSARANESQRVRDLFDSVDPFNETALTLPIDAMKAQKAKFLGPGTFGKGTAPTSAISTAEGIGTQTLPAVKEMTQSAAGKSQSLEQAVRAAGGIRGGAGELRDLGIKQSGTTGLVNNKSGKAADLLADDMYQRGFIPDNDPATLFDYLRNGNGRNVYASDATEGGFQRGMEQSMGDAPGAEVIAKPVPFRQVQNLRGSINEAWKDASMRGRNQEAAALKGMIAEIDSTVNAVASGKGSAGDYFPADIVKNWRDALAAHAEKKARFDTGPQARMFRQGGDGQSAIQGAEIPREFFNSRASQIEDAQAFKRLTQENPQLVGALKSYAVTDAAQQTTKNGMLSFNKFNKWMDSRSGAIKETMSESDRALLKEVLQGVKATDIANTGGMATGSNSAQNLEAAARLMGNGLLDSKLFDIAATKLPLGGFGLNALRKSSTGAKAETLGGLLSDPELFSAQLKKAASRQKPGQLQGLLSTSGLDRFGYRVAPLLAADY